MAIFSRRTLQRLINENAGFLTKNQTKNHVDKLNLKEFSKRLNYGNFVNELVGIYLNTEWEIVILNALSKFGEILYEKRRGSSNPDIYFTSSKLGFQFLGDITCITGTQDKDNISLSFKNEIEKIAEQNDLAGNWKITLGKNDLEVMFCKTKPNVKLVGKGQFETKIFNTDDFQNFIENIKKAPDKNHSYSQVTKKDFPERTKSNEIDVHSNVIIDLNIEYKPSNSKMVYFSNHQNNFLVSLEDNNIYSALKRKRDQLIKTRDDDEFLGIILCNGNNESFYRVGATLNNLNTYNLIHKFLGDYNEIDFVLTVSSNRNFISSTPPTIETNLFNGYGKNKLSKDVVEFFEQDLLKHFPKPTRSVETARNVLKLNLEKKEKFFMAGYCNTRGSTTTVKISSRTLLELLSGKIPWQETFHYLGFERKLGTPMPNTFLRMLEDGKMFTKTIIEKGSDDKDDDWIVFEFKEDPAISPFKMPDKYK